MDNKRRKKYAPLRTFSWSKEQNISPDQQLIQSTVVEWYDAKHRKVSFDEINFINSISVQHCPLCGSNHFVKSGRRKDGIQRYLCKDCKSRFTPLTNTIFDSGKIPISEWIEFLLHLFEFYSLQSTAYDNRNSPTTTKYWILKVFEVLKGIQDEIILDRTIYLDETYFSKIKSQTIIKDGKKLRGIFRNKIGVGVACNDKESIFIVTNTSKPSRASTKRTYEKHIAKGATIIHDDEKSHNVLIEDLDLISHSYASMELKNLKDKDNPLYSVNHLHLLLKRFMRAHGGYDRDHLQDWLNLFWFIMNDPKDKYDKVLKFLRMAINSSKRVRYRDALSKKHD